MINAVKKLTDEQIDSFDTDYIANLGGWTQLECCINKAFPQGKFSFLDIGGGNGIFTDKLLARYGRSKGTVIDNSKHILAKNIKHDRKNILECDVENIRIALQGEKYDLIFFNWVLHHLVKDSYKDTLGTISKSLEDAKHLLSEKGKLSIFENCYISLSLEKLPSEIIFHALSSKILAKYITKLGANTAGVGVCYLSESLWRSIIEREGFEIENCVHTQSLKVGFLKSLFCHIRGINIVHFFCSII